tara:strand:- start:6133 stop:7581 length:1449 start_codon:yes stop_codon:yes gene_type:complete
LQIPVIDRHLAGWVIAPYLIAALLLTLPQLLQPAGSQHRADLISVAMASERSGPWQAVELGSLQLPADHGWLRAVFTVPVASAADHAPPLGLYLSGTFSARVLWNGQETGFKGLPSVRPEGETAGPIDAIIHLPADTVRPGNNTALLELSSHYRQHSLNSIIHGSETLPGLRLASYSSEIRRPIGYYAAPLLGFTLLVIATFVIVSANVPERRLALVMTSALLVAAGAEVFRAFYAYPYLWHMLRLGMVASALMVFACTLPFYIGRRNGFRLPTAGLLAITAAGVTTTLWFGPPQDIVHSALWASVTVSLFLAWRSTHVSNKNRVFQVSALGCLVLSLMLDRDLFFDQYLYAATVPLLALLCRPMSIAIQPRKPDQLTVSSAGRTRVLDCKDILTVQGAGNYSEIRLASAETILDDRSLKDLLDLLPANFTRAHRSHLVNLDAVQELRSLGGGKYELVLTHQQRCPLSRTHVKTLRESLGHR